MSERCKVCDRPECDVKAAAAAYYATPVRDVDALIVTQERHAAACEACERNRVDWRARARAAEQWPEQIAAWLERRGGNAIIERDLAAEIREGAWRVAELRAEVEGL